MMVRGVSVMRVILNELPALGQKTGIGHYTAQLVRCLRQQAGNDVIDGFPQRWGKRVWGACAKACSFLEQKPNDRDPSRKSLRWALTSVREKSVGRLKQCGRTIRAQHFRAFCRRQPYDLYHEPNFIPLPIDCPTVATLHDLSFLLHPEWHPRDRIVYFERHFQGALAR